MIGNTALVAEAAILMEHFWTIEINAKNMAIKKKYFVFPFSVNNEEYFHISALENINKETFQFLNATKLSRYWAFPVPKEKPKGPQEVLFWHKNQIK